MNTPVSFELVKLLKEKGFDRVTTSAYHKNSGELIFTDWDNVESNDDILIPKSFNTDKESWLISAPTIAEVVMWLYEKYGVWVSVVCDCYGILWYANLSVASEKNWDNIDLRHEIISASKKFPNEHNSPTEAYEAAIEYTLKNLIP